MSISTCRRACRRRAPRAPRRCRSRLSRAAVSSKRPGVERAERHVEQRGPPVSSAGPDARGAGRAARDTTSAGRGAAASSPASAFRTPRRRRRRPRHRRRSRTARARCVDRRVGGERPELPDDDELVRQRGADASPDASRAPGCARSALAPVSVSRPSSWTKRLIRRRLARSGERRTAKSRSRPSSGPVEELRAEADDEVRLVEPRPGDGGVRRRRASRPRPRRHCASGDQATCRRPVCAVRPPIAAREGRALHRRRSAARPSVPAAFSLGYDLGADRGPASRRPRRRCAAAHRERAARAVRIVEVHQRRLMAHRQAAAARVVRRAA